MFGLEMKRNNAASLTNCLSIDFILSMDSLSFILSCFVLTDHDSYRYPVKPHTRHLHVVYPLHHLSWRHMLRFIVINSSNLLFIFCRVRCYLSFQRMASFTMWSRLIHFRLHLSQVLSWINHRLTAEVVSRVSLSQTVPCCSLLWSKIVVINTQTYQLPGIGHRRTVVRLE